MSALMMGHQARRFFDSLPYLLLGERSVELDQVKMPGVDGIEAEGLGTRGCRAEDGGKVLVCRLGHGGLVREDGVAHTQAKDAVLLAPVRGMDLEES